MIIEIWRIIDEAYAIYINLWVTTFTPVMYKDSVRTLLRENVSLTG